MESGRSVCAILLWTEVYQKKVVRSLIGGWVVIECGVKVVKSVAGGGKQSEANSQAMHFFPYKFCFVLMMWFLFICPSLFCLCFC